MGNYHSNKFNLTGRTIGFGSMIKPDITLQKVGMIWFGEN